MVVLFFAEIPCVICPLVIRIGQKTPIKTSSADVVFAEISVKAPNFATVFSSESTALHLYGESTLSFKKGDAVLTKDLQLNSINEELYAQLHIKGNVLVCGNITQNGCVGFGFNQGEVIHISQEEYQKYLRGMYTITFDADGGEVSESERAACYGELTEALPTPIKDYYTFEGRYTKEGTSPVTPASLQYNTDDVTLYAHWQLNPLSDWVKASDAPEDAQIVGTKWSYSLREWKTSNSSVMSGYVRDDSKTTHVTNWNGSVTYYDSQRATSETCRYVGTRQVENGTETYLYLFYNPSTYAASLDHKIGFLEAGYWRPTSQVYFWNPWYSQSGREGYTTPDLKEAWNYPLNKGSTRTVYKTQYGYQNGTLVYTYHFYKDSILEATTDPTGQTNVHSVVKLVKYRNK